RVGNRLLRAAAGVPRVLRVAPDAADVAALEPHEMRGSAGRRAFALEREEQLRDAQRRRVGGGRRVGRGGGLQGFSNSAGANAWTVSILFVNTFVESRRCAVGNHRPSCCSQPSHVYATGGGSSPCSTISQRSTRWFARST